MTLLPRSLQGRLLATAALFIALALAATGVAVYFALHRFVQGQVDQRLDGQLMTLAAALDANPDGTVVLTRNVDAPPFDNPHTGWFWLIRTPTHTWLSGGFRSVDVALPPIPPGPYLRPRHLEGRGPGDRPIRARADHVLVGGQDVVVLAAAPLEALNGPLRDALFPLATAILVLGAGLTIATILQVRLGLRPLARLRADLAAVRTGAYERLPGGHPAEVQPLAVEINTLLDQHAANLERARRHVANLAHALKTPLAGLSLALDDAGRDPDRSLRSLTLAMDRRIRHHLSRARAAALGPAARASLPLAARVADHAAAFAKIYADRALRCSVAIPSYITVACDPQDLDEVIGNVLDNGFKWARSEVRASAVVEAPWVLIRIEDDGPGVDPVGIDAILRPGQRLDETVPGDGFGLAIVRELVELYGGEVQLSRSGLGGLCVALTLPWSAALWRRPR